MQCQTSQTADHLRTTLGDTIERINRTGEPEYVTVNGENRLVLLSPEAFESIARELEMQKDSEAISRSLADVRAGRVYTAEESHQLVRSRILAMREAKGRES